MPHLPQRRVQLMDDHLHLLTASKSHNGVVASKRAGLGQVGHWRDANGGKAGREQRFGLKRLFLCFSQIIVQNYSFYLL